MTKQQRLANTAEGFFAGLVAAGWEGRFAFRNRFLDWELPFYRAWGGWEPKDRSPEMFPVFAFGGSANGTVSEARSLLFAVSSRSPFADYDNGLNPQPATLEPLEYLQSYVKGASPQEWVDLAQAFIAQDPQGQLPPRSM